MTYKGLIVRMLALCCVLPLLAEDAAESSAETVQEDPALEAELKFAEALVDNGYPDFAPPVFEAIKKKWPAAEARLFAIEVRGLLSCGQFDEAEKKIAALPDRKGTKYWAARLEMANSYFGRGQKEECMKIYDEFFKLYPKPPKDIRKFYNDASFMYGILLKQNGQIEKAAECYQRFLDQLTDQAEWCQQACETADLYINLIETSKDKAKVDEYHKKALKIVNSLLYKLDMPIFFGRGVSMSAHLEQLKGSPEKASERIDEYRDQLQELHNQIVEFDPDGKAGVLRQSPLPECLYLQAKILWDAAKDEYKKTKRNDEKVKSYMFGPKGSSGKREVSKGAFAMAQNVFLNYETSTWAPAAGDLVQEIKEFAEKSYKAKITTKITPEQIRKVREAQFRDANEKFLSGQIPEAIAAYYTVLAKFPEFPESIVAIENILNGLLDLTIEEKDETKKSEYRLDADTIEGYLSERFAGAKDKTLMTAAGDAVLRIAAKEREYKQPERADHLYHEFCCNYTRHSTAPLIAAGQAQEFQKGDEPDYGKALSYWKIIEENYTNTTHYATSLAQQSYCYGKLGDPTNEIAYINRYLPIETLKIRRLQAQFQLAQMYQKDGLRMLSSVTNLADEAEIEAAEKRGTAQIIRAVKNFTGFIKETEEAIKDPGTPAEDKEKYGKLREAAYFMIGECWGRMSRPEKNLKMYRERAAKSYEDYVEAYPDGQWAKAGYVKLGTIYTALGELEKSKEALDRLSKRFPDSSEAKDAKPRLAKNLIEMGMKKEGTEIYAEMLRTEGGAYTATQFYNAGEALIEAKSWELANQAYEKAIRLIGTNSVTMVARCRLGIAKTAWKQGSLAEAREAIEQFLADPKMAKMLIAADANFMLVEVASAQGRTEKDTAMRTKYFNAAIGALKKVRQYWAKKPQWEQDQLDLLSADVLINRMKAEEAMDLKEEAHDTCAAAAGKFQVFLQAHGVSDRFPFEQMDAGQKANLERCYATMIPLFAKLGSEQADRVVKFGQEYLRYFPEGKAKSTVENCMNAAKADLPAGGAKAAPAPVAKPAEADENAAPAEESAAEEEGNESEKE